MFLQQLFLSHDEVLRFEWRTLQNDDIMTLALYCKFRLYHVNFNAILQKQDSKNNNNTKTKQQSKIHTFLKQKVEASCRNSHELLLL